MGKKKMEQSHFPVPSPKIVALTSDHNLSGILQIESLLDDRQLRRDNNRVDKGDSYESLLKSRFQQIGVKSAQSLEQMIINIYIFIYKNIYK